MKILILLGLIVAFTASTNALQCYTCSNVHSMAECRQPQNLRTCQSNEGSCELHIRRRGSELTYYSECKSTDACQNNVANNPTDCDPKINVGPESVCRCCCQTDLCNCFGTPDTPLMDPTTSPTTTPRELFCDRPPKWEKGATVCPFDAEKYSLDTVCEYRCFEGYTLVGNEKTTCVKANKDPRSFETKWDPENPRCVPPRGRCRDPPSWSEGDVSCDDEAVGGGWEVGDMCRYSCPEGQIIFGARKATCTAIIDTVTNERDYVFIGGPPCCRDRPVTCPEPDPWDGGIIECGEGLPNGRYALNHRCEYICREGFELVEGELDYTVCRLEDPGDRTNRNTVWLPRPPRCEEEFIPRCETPPVWENGTVVCDDERPDGGWNQGDTCDYICPEGSTLIGISEAECLPTVVENILRFSPGPPCCEPACDPNVPADILFVLDHSTSITARRWPIITTFVNNVIERFDLKFVRFGVVVYGRGVLESLNIPFDYTNDKEDLQDRVTAIPYNNPLSGTETVAALNFARTDAFQPDFGDREDVSNYVIFVTDGVSFDSKDLGNGRTTLDDAAELLHGITNAVYAIGVGNFNLDELQTIASSDDFIATTSDFTRLNELLDDVTTVTCVRCDVPV